MVINLRSSATCETLVLRMSWIGPLTKPGSDRTEKIGWERIGLTKPGSDRIGLKKKKKQQQKQTRI